MEGMGFSREKCDPLRQFGRGREGLGGEDSVAAVFANLMPQSYQLHAHCKSSFGTDAAMWLLKRYSEFTQDAGTEAEGVKED